MKLEYPNDFKQRTLNLFNNNEEIRELLDAGNDYWLGRIIDEARPSYEALEFFKVYVEAYEANNSEKLTQLYEMAKQKLLNDSDALSRRKELHPVNDYLAIRAIDDSKVPYDALKVFKTYIEAYEASDPEKLKQLNEMAKTKFAIVNLYSEQLEIARTQANPGMHR